MTRLHEEKCVIIGSWILSSRVVMYTLKSRGQPTKGG